MKKCLIAAAALSMLIMVLASTGLGQQGGPQPLPFDPKTVETVQGMVVEAPVIKTGGIPEMEHLTLETERRQLTVVLGPNWFLAQQNWQIAALDRIEVTGSRVDLDGKPGLVAQKVKKDGQVIELRDQTGRPLWGPPRRQVQ